MTRKLKMSRNSFSSRYQPFFSSGELDRTRTELQRLKEQFNDLSSDHESLAKRADKYERLYKEVKMNNEQLTTGFGWVYMTICII